MNASTKRGWIAALILLCSVLSAAAEAPVPRISGDEVLALAAELSGPLYEGRGIGTEGGRRAAGLLEGILRKAGYRVQFQDFPERPGLNRGEAVLEAILPGGARQTFVYRKDFRETARGGWTGGTAEGPLRLLEARGQDFPGGRILLIPASLYDPAALDSYAARGAKGVILELPEGSPAQRSGYTGAAPGALVEPKQGMIVLAVSSDAFRRLADAAAGKARVRMASPVRFEDARGRNIVAAWNGDGGDFRPKLAFIAHYDHMGTDADGSRFPGALDNASGTALAVRLAEAIALGSTRADFALVLTDGEEVNLGGSWALVRDPPFPLRGVSVVNLDMVGSRADMELSVFHNGDPGSRQLADRIAGVVREAGFTVMLRSPVYNLDHGHLPRAGARAVSVCEYDTTLYHTKEDLPENLSAPELSALGGVLLKFALEELGAD